MLIGLDLYGHMRLVLGITQAENAGLACHHVRCISTDAMPHGLTFVLQCIVQLGVVGVIDGLITFWVNVSASRGLLVAFRQVLIQRQLNPLVTLWVLLVDWHALGGLELSLSHGLLFLLVVLVCPAHCMLNADLVQLIRTDATVS